MKPLTFQIMVLTKMKYSVLPYITSWTTTFCWYFIIRARARTKSQVIKWAYVRNNHLKPRSNHRHGEITNAANWHCTLITWCVYQFGTIPIMNSQLQARSWNCVKRLQALCLSVCPRGTTRLSLDGFSLNSISVYLSKICRENLSFFKIRQK